MKVKIFWREGCPKCPPAKELGQKLKDQGLDVQLLGFDEAEGLTEATIHQVMATPSIIVVDDKDNEVSSWRGETPDISEVKKVLKLMN